MGSKVRTAAVVAGLVAFGATDGADAYAQPPTGSSQTTPAAPPSGRKPPRKTTAHAKTVVRTGLIATLPGFEMLPDGGSRLFVELTKTATVTEKRDARTLTYTIRGARVEHRNNENALVTVHFNTPVTRARLLPAGGNLLFSVDLRAETPATWRLVDATDGGGSVLQIDFPKGVFLPPGEFDPTGLAPPGGPGDVNMAPAAQPPPAPAPRGPAGPS
jgi:glucose/arabinose dehydrogenase